MDMVKSLFLLLSLISSIHGSPVVGPPIDVPSDFVPIQGNGTAVGDDAVDFDREITDADWISRAGYGYDDDPTMPHGPKGNGTDGDDNGEDRVIGGFYAYDGEFPFMARVFVAFTNGGPMYPTCGGSLISTIWVLSAAHCVIPDAANVAVRLGSNQQNSGGQFLACTNWIYHASYDPVISESTISAYDIVMLKVGSPVQLNNYVQTALVQNANVFYNFNTRFTAMGWGRTDNNPNGGQSDWLKAAQQSNRACSWFPPNNPSSLSVICASGWDSIPSRTCRGDSGGFLGMYSGWDAKWVVNGITSYSYGDACTDPHGFTSVSYYNSWIYYVSSNY